VERVGAEDDATRERDLLARQPIGVPGAVPPLVAVANQPCNLVQLRHGLNDLLSRDGVLPDQRPLAIIERTGLVEHLVRDPDFPDVMELSRGEQFGAVVPKNAKLVGDGVAEMYNVVGVRARTSVARVERRGRHAHRRAPGRPCQVLIVRASMATPVAVAAYRLGSGRRIAVLRQSMKSYRVTHGLQRVSADGRKTTAQTFVHRLDLPKPGSCTGDR